MRFIRYFLVLMAVQVAFGQSGAPSLSTLLPNTAPAGSPGFALTANGSGFLIGTIILWNGMALPTTDVSASQLVASVPASFIAAQGVATITVQNPSGATSNSILFTITQQAPGSPILTNLSPAYAAPGGPSFTLTVYGSNFVNGAVIEWNGAPLSTNFQGSTTQLTAFVPASLITSAGTASIAVVDLNGTISNSIAFQITSTNPLTIAQIADGADWQTLFQVVNIDQVPVSYSFQFWDDNGNPLLLPFSSGPAGIFGGTLDAGGTAFAETPGTSTDLSEGWAQVTSSGRIGVLTIFRQSVPGGQTSEGTVTGTQSGERIFLPFDNTNGFVTGVAVANTSPTKTLIIDSRLRGEKLDADGRLVEGNDL